MFDEFFKEYKEKKVERLKRMTHEYLMQNNVNYNELFKKSVLQDDEKATSELNEILKKEVNKNINLLDLSKETAKKIYAFNFCESNELEAVVPPKKELEIASKLLNIITDVLIIQSIDYNLINAMRYVSIDQEKRPLIRNITEIKTAIIERQEEEVQKIKKADVLVISDFLRIVTQREINAVDYFVEILEERWKYRKKTVVVLHDESKLAEIYQDFSKLLTILKQSKFFKYE